MSLSRDQINNWLRDINIQNKHCFDIGSGSPEKWTLHKVKGKPSSYTAFDFNPEFAQYKIDLNEPLEKQTLPDYTQNQITFAIEVLEHIWNPIQAIKNLSDMTNEACYISTPFINPIHCTVDYMRYTDEWYEKVLPKYGFKKVDVKYRIATNGLQHLKNFYQSEGLRISKIRLKNNEGHKINLIGIMVSAFK